MTRARDVLYRFRPAGAPGAASATGVPADRVADVVSELAPLFAELARTERECADIVARAGRDADDVHALAVQQARGLVTAAGGQVDGERAAAMVRVRHLGEQESAAAVAAAEGDAAQVRRRADERMQSLVDSVLGLVAGLVSESVSEAASRSQGSGARPVGRS